MTHTFKDFRTNQDAIIKTQHYLEQLQELTNQKITSVSEQMNVHFRVVGALQVIDLVCNDISNFVTDLYLGVDAMRHSTLSTLLMTPEQLMKHLKGINLMLRTGSTLPLAVTEENIHEYYELIRVTAWIVNGQILRFFLHVPLKHIERTYNLFEVLPVPTATTVAEKTNMYAFVQPQMDFIAISLDEQRFIPMSQRHVDQCRGARTKVCPGPNVVNHMTGGPDTCETAYYKGIEPTKEICDVRLTYIATSIWKEVTGTSSWIFVLPQEELLTVTCTNSEGTPEHEGTEWVQGTGLLTLPSKCQMIGSTFRIYSRISYKSKESVNISNEIRIPKPRETLVDLDDKTYDILYKSLKNLTSHVRYVSNSLNDLKSSSIRLESLDSILKQYEPDNYMPYVTHSVSCGVIIVISFFVIWYFKLYKICLRRCSGKKKLYLPVLTNSSDKRDGPTPKIEMELDEMPLEDRIKISKRNKKDSPH